MDKNNESTQRMLWNITSLLYEILNQKAQHVSSLQIIKTMFGWIKVFVRTLECISCWYGRLSTAMFQPGSIYLWNVLQGRITSSGKRVYTASAVRIPYMHSITLGKLYIYMDRHILSYFYNKTKSVYGWRIGTAYAGLFSFCLYTFKKT